MPKVSQQKICSVSIEKAFEIVKDFSKYPEFLPWCAGARLKSTQMIDAHTQEFIADLIIKYKIFTEVFTTKVLCNSQTYDIDISYVSGPFHHLNSSWRFAPIQGDDTQTKIDFMIDFSVRFGPLQSVLGLFFEQAMIKMITAFETRFQSLP